MLGVLLATALGGKERRGEEKEGGEREEREGGEGEARYRKRGTRRIERERIDRRRNIM